MMFYKNKRQGPTEPQLATMIDVFSILIIFLIAGTAMDTSVIEIPMDLLMGETRSKDTAVNAPQVTLKDKHLVLNFIKEEIDLKEIEVKVSPNVESQKEERTEHIEKIKTLIRNYLSELDRGNKKTFMEMQLLKSINLVADKETSYEDIYKTIKFLKSLGMQSTILVGTERNAK